MSKGRISATIFLLIAAFLPFISPLIKGGQLGPTDHIRTMIDPSAPAPEKGWDVLQADGVLQFWPWRDLVFESWRRGETPILNPYQLAGQPLAGNSQSGAFYPLHIIFSFLPFDTPLKIIFLAILHAGLAAFGMFFLLRRSNVEENSASFSGVTFAVSQFAMAWAPLSSVMTTVCWIPWILWGLTFRGLPGTVRTAFPVAMLLLAGHLQFAAYGLMAAFIFGLVQIIAEWKSSSSKPNLILPVLGLVLGGVTALPQVGLVLEHSQTSHRKNVPSEDGYQAYLGGALMPFEALSLVHPKLMGDTQAPAESLKQWGVPSGYWPHYVKPNANPAESAFFLAPAAVCLAFIGLLARRTPKGESQTPKNWQPIAFGIIGLLGILLAFGTPLNRMLFFAVPGWSATGSPGRAIVLIVFSLSLLSSFGWQALSQLQSKRSLALAGLPLLLLVIGFQGQSFVASSLKSQMVTDMSKVIGVLGADGIMSSLIVAGVGVLSIVVWMSQKVPYRAELVAGIILASSLTTQVVWGPKLEIPMASESERFTRTVTESQAWSLFSTPKATFPPNLRSIERRPDLFGYDSILQKSVVEKLKSLTGTDPAPPENGNMMLYRGSSLPDADSRLPELGVGEENRVVGGKIIEDGFDHQVIQLDPGQTSILIRDRFYEGMSVSRGKIESENGFRRVTLREGAAGTVRIDYPGRNRHWWVWIGLSILAGLWIRTRSRTK